MTTYGAVPIQIRSIKIAGAERTRASTIEAEFVGLFEVETFEELVESLQRAHRGFNELGIFKHVDVQIISTEEEGVADVLVQVQEKSIPGLKLNISQGASGSAGEVKGSLLNAAGFAESIDVEAVLGKSNSKKIFVLL